ncbi:signal recognition particle-docking protein FtsY, partial [Methylobacterium sp. WL18]
MASEEKPGWFGRLFGRKGQGTGDGTAEETSETELPAEAPASPSEGQPDYATGAEDVAHIPLPPEETDAPVADVVEGADLLPIAGEPERP